MNFAHPDVTPRGPQIKPRVPGKAGRRSGHSKYPFDRTEVGQSFFVPNALAPKKGARGILWVATKWARRRGLKYSPFSVETFPMGIRVTRVAVGDEMGNRGLRYDFNTWQVGEARVFLFESLPSRYAVCTALSAWKSYRADRSGFALSYAYASNAVVATRIA